MRFTTILVFILSVSIFSSCSAFQKNFSIEGEEFRFSAKYSSTSAEFINSVNNGEFTFIQYRGNKYNFYDQLLSDTLAISIYNLNDIIPLVKNSIYNISFEVKPGYPSTFGLVISQNNSLIFEGISIWSLPISFSFDKSSLKIEISKELSEDSFFSEGCENKITPLEIKFSNKGNSIFLEQNQIDNLNDLKIFLRYS